MKESIKTRLQPLRFLPASYTKKWLLVILYVSVPIFQALACPVCDRNKPKLLKGISHGTGPESNWDYLIVGGMLVITLFTLFFSIKWLIQPKENHKSHIKYSILNPS
jgi:hypothetical protein